MPRTRSSVKWFCKGCLQIWEKKKKCPNCKEELRWECKKSGKSVPYSKFTLHVESCVFCKGSPQMESIKTSKKRKFKEAIQGMQFNLIECHPSFLRATSLLKLERT
jgi:hypothetical protein